MARFDMQPRWPEIMASLPGFTGTLAPEALEFIEMMNRRDLALEDWLGDNTEGGSRWGTVVVAASDSSDLGKAGADFVADGTDDQDTLIEAALALPRLFGVLPFGAIVLLEGTFNVSGSVFDASTIFSLIEWRGTGRTTLKIPSGTNGTFTLLPDGGLWRGVTVDGNGSGQTSGVVALSTGAFFRECVLIAGKAGVILAPGLFSTTHCVDTTFNGTAGDLVEEPLITMLGLYENCTLFHRQGGFRMTGAAAGSALSVIGGSVVRASVTLADGLNTEHVLLDSGANYSELRVEGVLFPNTGAPARSIVHVGAGPAWIRNNDILCSTLEAAPDAHQILIDGGDRGMVSGNTITGSGAGGAAIFDAIHLQGGAHHNTIQGNRTGYQVSPGERSGIYLDATTSDNTAIDVLNDITNYATAAVIDLGTNNLTTLPYATTADLEAAVALVNEAAPAVPVTAAAASDSTLTYMVNEAGLM